MGTSASRLEFYELLLQETSPEDLEFAAEFQRAVESGASDIGTLGPEFGIDEAGTLLLGPLVVIIGKHLLEVGSNWLTSIALKIAEGYIVDKGKSVLKAWLDAPAKEKLGPALTDKGKAELIAMVSKLAKESKLPADEADKAVVKIVRLVIGSEG